MTSTRSCMRYDLIEMPSAVGAASFGTGSTAPLAPSEPVLLALLGVGLLALAVYWRKR